MKPYRAMLSGIIIVAACAAVAIDLATMNKHGVEAYNRGDYRSAASIFTDALKLAPGDPFARKNCIAAYRSLAAVLLEKGDADNAASALRQGLSAAPDSPELRSDLIMVLVNRGKALCAARDFVRAQQAASEALRLDDNNAAANTLAGDIAYERHDLAGAGAHWQRALKADPENSEMVLRINKLQKEEAAGRSYSKMEAYHFDIRFDYRTLGNGVCDLRDFLMQAYEKIGRDFERFPEYPIVVILSGESDFRMVNSVPEFAAGLYDGKIRVPVNYSRFPLKTLKGIIFHEYTHAIVYDLAGSHCPIWLNEGIAMREMDTPGLVATDLLRRALATGSTLTIEQMSDRSGTWCNPDRVALAYAQAWIMAEYLLSRWGFHEIKKMLQRFKEGTSFAAILREEMNRTPDQFEKEWQKFASERL